MNARVSDLDTGLTDRDGDDLCVRVGVSASVRLGACARWVGGGEDERPQHADDDTALSGRSWSEQRLPRMMS